MYPESEEHFLEQDHADSSSLVHFERHFAMPFTCHLQWWGCKWFFTLLPSHHFGYLGACFGCMEVSDCGKTSDLSEKAEIALWTADYKLTDSLTYWVWSRWRELKRTHCRREHLLWHLTTLSLFTLWCNKKNTGQQNLCWVYRFCNQWHILFSPLMCLPLTSGHLQFLLVVGIYIYFPVVCSRS